jgi:hypothetical protein
MQEGEETLLHTSMLHYITSRFFPGPVVGIMHVISNILTADDFRLLGYDAVENDKWVPTFWRKFLFLYFGHS